MAFQYADDVLDLYGQEAAAGKTLFRDLQAQLCTLPVLDACALLPAGVPEALLGGRIGVVERALREPEVRKHLLARAARCWHEASRALPGAVPQGTAAEAVSVLLGSYAPAFPLSPLPIAASSAA